MSGKPDILNNEEHIMLLYDSDKAREDLVFDCINKEIGDGRLAVYASIDAEDSAHLSRLASRINDYEKHVDKGNLRLVSTKQCTQRAREGDMRQFYAIRESIEQTARERQACTVGSHTLVVTDRADSLSKDEKFDECSKMEKSWQRACTEWKRAGLRICVICPHLRTVLDKGEEQSIAINHSRKITVQ